MQRNLRLKVLLGGEFLVKRLQRKDDLVGRRLYLLSTLAITQTPAAGPDPVGGSFSFLGRTNGRLASPKV